MENLSLRPAQRLVVASLLTLAFGVSPVAGDDNDVIQIEEHWELQIGGPDTARSAPQVTMIMSPSDSVEEDFFAFTINHSSFPDYSAGGYQLQRWRGAECQQSFHGVKTSPLDIDGEVITWVQKLTINEGNLRFQVINGQSSSWNNFGGEGFAIVTPTQLTRLNGYRPAISLEQSGIGYAGNRVSSLVLQKLRWITADGEEHEMVAPIDIDSDLDP
jgi:hypothetical protein